MKVNLSLIACLVLASSQASATELTTPKGVSFTQLIEADSKMPAAQIYIAESHLANQNFNAASEHYISAIELGVDSAVWNLMSFVDSGVLEGEPLQTVLMKIKSMAASNKELTLFLANFYHNRQGYEGEAFHWVNNALRLGVSGVSEIMANYIIDQKGEAHRHYTSTEAATLLKDASDNGSASASFDLAEMFDSGKKLPRNLGQARHYYNIAAKAGIIEANFKLGYFMEHGIGGDKDLIGAATMYEQLLNTDAAAEVHYRLSRIYMYNPDVFDNAKVDGVAHLIKSAELGNTDALYKVGVATYYGSDGFKVNIDKAIEHLKSSAYGGNKLAAKRLIQIYKNGDRTIAPNKELMREFQRILTEAPKY
ncbi:tetratricopeptide repeat protein [Vibrio coralliirubri]|uniref:tetratricopeptide repeat protein n=1 Tax=Vibrio coralliirubri TaxID=1516159 RepID=UPI0022838DA0|nr:tetratricopeptide repeat protein [Vibrio coralliirubri]MCY9860923.1 tetratricopeptide repeat protein [Vibrio coralliirubri]